MNGGRRLACVAALITIAAAPQGARSAELSGRVVLSGQPAVHAVISLDGVRTGEPPDARVQVIDHRDLGFVPHVLAVRAGTTVRFDNSDGMPCRFYSVSADRMFVLRPEPAKPVSVSFDRPGVTEVRCAEHGRMIAYVVVKETPYFAVTDERGWYQIPDVPPGRHAVQAWYEGTVIATKAVELRTGTTTLDFNASRPERKAGAHASGGDQNEAN